ncbi:MAG TPA: styrene monooxygenase/indole monooxygenase family protein [Streptosporangiaceae bacterium]|nr:styrene monooxygenase/indole monooxygenase family protein [Streptosporangiaceae bacterium]
MPEIGIVGAGISGLHLTLRLQQLGVPTVLYAEHGPDEIAMSRPSNLVVRFGHTRERERLLGITHWDRPDLDVYGLNVAAETTPPVRFFGKLSKPASGVDFRVYLPRLIHDYLDRGGEFEVTTPETTMIDRLAERHDLVVVATKQRAFEKLFPKDTVRSPYSSPQRSLCGGLYHGIAPSDPSWVHFQMIPEVGEIFCTRLVSLDGPIHGMVIEAIPGRPLEPLSYLSYDEAPAEFNRTLLELLAEHAPPLRERIDAAEFGLARPIDLLQGRITPTVRGGWAQLSGDRYALAVGDAWVLNDPISGQGANLGSRCAFALADLISAGGPYDEEFCRRAEKELWRLAEPVVNWSNSALGPPPDNVLDIMRTATTDQRIADAFVNQFDDPAAMWEVLRSADNTRTWLSQLWATA